MKRKPVMTAALLTLLPFSTAFAEDTINSGDM